ncbi:MAG: UDP-3-O-(3-hydroxymyristoyl)glucosamine N-acyltransferase [Pseudomonadota bacterium]
MADTRFFDRAGPFTLAQIYKAARLDPLVESAPSFVDIGRLEDAGPDQVTFFDNIKYRDALRSTRAGACFVHPDYADEVPAGTLAIVTPQPYKAYALTAQIFYPGVKPAATIHAASHVADDAVIGVGTTIEAGAVIESGAQIGANCWIGANTVIGRGVVLGDGCIIGANATVSHTVIGNHVRLYPGVRIGQDGFGFAIDPAGHIKVPQLGRVVIEDGVEIGANTAIDRGAIGDTHIGAGCWIDNLVQIGHNVRLGRGCVIVSQVGIAGSTVLGDFVVLAGQAGIAGHLKIGSGVRVAAQSGVMRDIPPKSDVMGSPAMPIKQYMRQVATLTRLTRKRGKDD